MKFTDLNLIEPIERAIAAQGYTAPTPIQAQSIPYLLAGKDLLGVAQTGTGKTAAFALPLLQRLVQSGARPTSGAPRALILAPTRELASQIDACIKTYARHLRLFHTVVFGGAPMRPQVRDLQRGVDILVATPGRLLDHINQRNVRLNGVETFILDEADRMLDMGFVGDVKKMAAMLPKAHQTVLFSATMPPSVAALAQGLLNDPVRVEVAAQATTAERVEQRVLFVAKQKKRDLLTSLMDDEKIARVLIFTRTKHGADRVAKHLDQCGVKAGAIHGNKTQRARENALRAFRGGHLRALVATDIAARGIDVEGVTHVINFELPNDPESYVHRIGRTARGGADGIALSFCDGEERGYLRSIEKIIRQSVTVEEDHPFHSAEIANDPGFGAAKPKKRGGFKKRRSDARSQQNAGKPWQKGKPSTPSRRSKKVA
ncbi:DEAD/DEAH box helicase [Varunaivibrio sulfuroxidans]|uniref:DEAD-box ATP-dependent RNA helicase RhpA n=1 Tax=Varunaivibrio sulfuroxidans TaxID=1773489 RepID=A0A4V2UNU7_9PROT|nr:DEAD/DEAH box helicase [Varunaivibrio sulfuroxidans]TCS63441.1 ATP-dependent RNA helicase RhlE [Varunaivibrio sulfuroxidans]WES30413.1 DEAD/DEAH box helicase [Varunaivibrio sulfuroxidans]